MREPKVYEDLTDLAALKAAMEAALREYNLSPAVVPMQLVLFREAIEHSEQPPPIPPAPQRWAVPEHEHVWEGAFLLGPRGLVFPRGGCWRCPRPRPLPTLLHLGPSVSGGLSPA